MSLFAFLRRCEPAGPTFRFEQVNPFTAWMWKLFDEHGNLVCCSETIYFSQRQAKRAARCAQRIIGRAHI